MKNYKKHISIFLLVVFAWVLLPSAFVHEVFADHRDTVCTINKNYEGIQIEESHTHCDIFTTNTPLYDRPQIVLLDILIRDLIAELCPTIISSFFCFSILNSSSRAPPLS